MENKISTKEVMISMLSILVLVVSQTVANLIGSIAYVTAIPDWIGNIAFGIVYVLLTYFLLKILCIKLLKSFLENYGMGKPKLKLVWLISAVLLPAIVSVVLLCMPGELISNSVSLSQGMSIVTAALFYYGIGAGVVEEMVFRGIIMHTLESRWNKVVAILIPSMAFGLLHLIGKEMNFISILLLFVAGISVGILFSLITYESGSVWCSAIIHGVWNCIMIGGILNIGPTYDSEAIFSYILKSKSIIITGGDFGIETSIVSVFGYIIFALLAFYLWKRNQYTSQNKHYI
ncbi:CPBP family intramembrane metalloprotease [Tissierella carlieri]|uniref:CPBP family intramembrane metalloprotease n=1 Tax=Tissierella carlieri TaxID=689904 RepID=A0ABT1S503_9FIRM|nr:type II CAAX endopeptidase family protein [Tissierella carlieri]MCQ4921539.1 CPBP family intramembrane metalloprotease [Tissierella carlieri]